MNKKVGLGEVREESKYLALMERASQYLEGLLTKMEVGIRVMYFEETHGMDKIEAMLRFIHWAEENDKRDIIVSTLCHDLGGCQDALMSPRSSGY